VPVYLTPSLKEIKGKEGEKFHPASEKKKKREKRDRRRRVPFDFIFLSKKKEKGGRELVNAAPYPSYKRRRREIPYGPHPF